LKICIIGGGFYGCFLSKKLSEKYKVDLYEKETNIFHNSSAILNNQHRLHLGFHYPRSEKTIKQTINCFTLFKEEYGDFCFFPKNNMYLIHKDSLIKYEDYISIYRDNGLSFSELKIEKIPNLVDKNQFTGAIKTGEGIIDTHQIKKYFEKYIKESKNIKLITDFSVTEENIEALKKEYDFVINCSYNNCNIGLTNKFDVKYEFCALLLIRDFSSKEDAYTIMDGDYVSVYPTNSGYHTISSVSKTPFFKFENSENIDKNKLSEYYLKSHAKESIIHHAKKIINFNEKDIFGEYLSIKTKPKHDSDSDEREAIINFEGNYASVMSGKISVVYEILDKIKNNYNL
jgi:hypothetical protein